MISVCFFVKYKKLWGGNIPFESWNETLGDKIIGYRKEHGISQRKLTEFLSVDKTTIRDWESNKHKPIGKMKKRISEILLQY
ncbi:MAG: helix-turn-helix transcriptional regulator [Ignavibacteriaceae bacterium]